MTAPVSEGELMMILAQIEVEFRKASSRFGKFKSYHEGYAVILEEMDELWDAVKLNNARHPEKYDLVRREAIQVAAMAIRFLHDICPSGGGS